MRETAERRRARKLRRLNLQRPPIWEAETGFLEAAPLERAPRNQGRLIEAAFFHKVEKREDENENDDCGDRHPAWIHENTPFQALP